MFESESSLFLTKLLPVFLYPVGAAIALLLLAAMASGLGRGRVAAGLAGAAVLLLWGASAPIVGNWAYGTLEGQYPSRPIAETADAEVAIVLGGAVLQPVAPRVTAEFSEAGDRIVHAVRLYKAGKVKRILVTGGNIPWLPDAVPEADLIRDYLVEFGVPAAAIEVANQSRNTYENALEIKEIWDRQRFASALLVTSAAHMPRAMAVFRGLGLPVTASSTDVRAVPRSQATILDWLPDIEALDLTTRAVKEWLGYAAYKAQGYL
jgi:uncharacterized SAM-binding protein YcdF (DUF218 family)